MWQKLASILIGALIEQAPKLISIISNAISSMAQKTKEKIKNRKSAKKVNDAKTEHEIANSIDDLP